MARIRTNINLDESNKEYLDEMARKLNVSRSSLINVLIFLIANNHGYELFQKVKISSDSVYFSIDGVRKLK